MTQSTAVDKFNDGTLSAITRYKTPYFCNSQKIILSFASGDSLSLRTILGTPALEAMHSVLDLCDRKLVLKHLHVTLPLVMTEPSSVLPPSASQTLQCGPPISASGDSSEIIVMANGDGSQFLTHPSHSDDVVVTDSWEDNTFSRSVSNKTNPSVS